MDIQLIPRQRRLLWRAALHPLTATAPQALLRRSHRRCATASALIYPWPGNTLPFSLMYTCAPGKLVSPLSQLIIWIGRPSDLVVGVLLGLKLPSMVLML